MKISMETVIFYFVYLVFIILPHLTNQSQIPLDHEVDPALINGLLAASSVLFGVLTLVMAKQYEYFHGIELRLYGLIIINVVLFVNVANNIFNYAIGFDVSGVNAVIWTMSSFNANVFGAAYALIRLRKMRGD